MTPLDRARWDRIGLASGHAWATCTACGQEALQPRAGGRECFMTFECGGRMVVPADRPTPLQALRAGLIELDDLRKNPPLMNDTLRRMLTTEEDT